MVRVVLTLCAFAVVAQSLSAHAIRAHVHVGATTIDVDVKFDGESDLKGRITVTLQDATLRIMGTATSDVAGHCQFPRPPAGRYRIVAEDEGFGHRIEKTFDVIDGLAQDATTPPPVSNTPSILVGLGIIALITLLGYWFAGRKKGT